MIEHDEAKLRYLRSRILDEERMTRRAASPPARDRHAELLDAYKRELDSIERARRG